MVRWGRPAFLSFGAEAMVKFEVGREELHHQDRSEALAVCQVPSRDSHGNRIVLLTCTSMYSGG